MRGKYAGAMLKATKVGGKRYTTVKSLNKARLLAQAAEKATHGKVIQAGEIYRDDLIEAILEAILDEGLASAAGNTVAAWGNAATGAMSRSSGTGRKKVFRDSASRTPKRQMAKRSITFNHN